MLVMKAGAARVRLDELAFSPDGTGLFAPAMSTGLCHWPAFKAGAKSDVLTLPAKVVRRLAFAPDGRTLYAGSDQLCAFDVGSRTGAVVAIPKWAALWFGVSPDGGRLVVAETPQRAEGTRLTLWATDALDAPVRELVSASLVHSAPQFPAVDRFLQLEGTRLPDRRWEYCRVTRSAETGEVIERSAPLPDDPDQMVLSPDGRTVACRTRNVLRVYPSTGGWGTVPEIANDGKQHFTGIAYHPSGRVLAATSNDKTVKLYDAESGQISRTFTWDIGRMRSVCFSPDGLLAAAGSDTGKVVVWDVDV